MGQCKMEIKGECDNLSLSEPLFFGANICIGVIKQSHQIQIQCPNISKKTVKAN